MIEYNKLFVDDVTISTDRIFTYFVSYYSPGWFTKNVVCRFIQWSTSIGEIKTEFASIHELVFTKEQQSILDVMKPGEVDKQILHCLYMYLLEHNEEHLDILEKMK